MSSEGNKMGGADVTFGREEKFMRSFSRETWKKGAIWKVWADIGE